MKKIFYLLFLLITVSSVAQNKTNVVLIGLYHFNNPGFDQAKVKERNILEKDNQEALERITAKIFKKYKPAKVFVEYDYAAKAKLNQMYALYKKGKPFYSADTLKNNYYKRFYAENEIFQLGFRLAKKANNDSIFAMDYDEIPMRFDLVKSKIEAFANLSYDQYQSNIAKMSQLFNSCIDQNKLEDVLLCLNSAKQYQINKGSYISLLNRINKSSDFFGSDLVANWYKRNLIMYANVQNQVDDTDANIVIIAGAGHAAMMEEFLKNDDRFNLITLNQVL